MNIQSLQVGEERERNVRKLDQALLIKLAEVLGGEEHELQVRNISSTVKENKPRPLEKTQDWTSREVK